jgi:hypothetical protein
MKKVAQLSLIILLMGSVNGYGWEWPSWVPWAKTSFNSFTSQSRYRWWQPRVQAPAATELGIKYQLEKKFAERELQPLIRSTELAIDRAKYMSEREDQQISNYEAEIVKFKNYPARYNLDGGVDAAIKMTEGQVLQAQESKKQYEKEAATYQNLKDTLEKEGISVIYEIRNTGRSTSIENARKSVGLSPYIQTSVARIKEQSQNPRGDLLNRSYLHNITRQYMNAQKENKPDWTRDFLGKTAQSE